MPRSPKMAAQIPSLNGWGGVRAVKNRLGRSDTLLQNREAVAYALLCMANTKVTDIMSWDAAGNIQVKASDQIPDHALQAIKSIKQRTDKDGNSFLDIEMFDKVGVLRLLAKASGLLDNPEGENDNPSVIGINVQAPETIEAEVKDA